MSPKSGGNPSIPLAAGKPGQPRAGDVAAPSSPSARSAASSHAPVLRSWKARGGAVKTIITQRKSQYARAPRRQSRPNRPTPSRQSRAARPQRQTRRTTRGGRSRCSAGACIQTRRAVWRRCAAPPTREAALPNLLRRRRATSARAAAYPRRRHKSRTDCRSEPRETGRATGLGGRTRCEALLWLSTGASSATCGSDGAGSGNRSMASGLVTIQCGFIHRSPPRKTVRVGLVSRMAYSYAQQSVAEVLRESGKPYSVEPRALRHSSG